MPKVDEDGVVHNMTRHVYHSLKPPRTARPPGQPRKNEFNPNS